MISPRRVRVSPDDARELAGSQRAPDGHSDANSDVPTLAATMFALQRAAGNAAVARLISNRRSPELPHAARAPRQAALIVRRSSAAPAPIVSRQEDDEWSSEWGGGSTEQAGGSDWSSGETSGGTDWSNGSGEGAGGGGEGWGGGEGAGGGDSGQSGAGEGWEGGLSPGEGWEGGSSGPDEGSEEGESSWSDWWDETFGDGGDAAADLEEGEILAVEETFVPEEMAGVPDEGLMITAIAAAAGSAPIPAAPVSSSFIDLGRVGTRRVGDHAAGDDANRPQAFLNGGQTGTVAWAGGGGAGPRGNEGAGSVQNAVAPVYESRSNGADADAWVRSGTGRIDAVRSWLGANGGDQGNGWFVTPAAAARLNNHETQHVASSRGFYNAYLGPLLARVADRSLGLNVAATEEKAIGALTAIIAWPQIVSGFQSVDRAANIGMGTVDTADLGSGTYPILAGPGTVAGKAYTQRLKIPSEPTPT
jgi:hypothetical protein